MAVYSWSRRPTRHFGQVWVPFAQIEIRTAAGDYQAFAVQIDSGAVVSLLRRSVADLLGLQFEAGRRIELSAVGGGHTVAYVHELTVRIDGDGGTGLLVPFAIADKERVPNLLGRRGFFDVSQVDFDATLQETRVAECWLTDDQRRIWHDMRQFEADIIARWKPTGLPPEASGVVHGLVKRAAEVLFAVAGLIKLRREFAVPPLARVLFEVAAQFEYLMRDPGPRAQRYREFAKVTRYFQMRAWTDEPAGEISRDLRSEEHKGDRERDTREFEGVRGNFLRPDGKRVWDKWYCMTLRDLAREIGWEAEYRRWYGRFSTWAHGDPFSTQSVTSMEPRQALLQCSAYYARMLLCVADKMILSDAQYQFLRKLALAVPM